MIFTAGISWVTLLVKTWSMFASSENLNQNLKEKAVEEVKSPSIVAQEENVAEEVKNSLK